MNVDEVIRARVEEFIRDCADWNTNFFRPGSPLDWSKAKDDFKVIAARHFISGKAVGGAGATIGSPPEHSPEQERIVSIVKGSSDKAIVETELERKYPIYYEYTLERIGDEWKIAHLQTLLSSKSETVKDIDLNALARKILRPVPAKEFPIGLDRLFGGPVTLQTRHGLANTRISVAGTIEAPSGFLTCDDPGCWQWGASVFGLPIPPGKHAIELVLDDRLKIVGAARIVFDRREYKGFFAPAIRIGPKDDDTGESHVISVDGGMIGFADAAAIIELPRRSRERLDSQLAKASLAKKQRGAVSVPLAGTLQAWAIDSGCGDGGYCAYWHLDDDEQPISLIFDFADLGLSKFETLCFPVEIGNSPQLVKDKDLRAWGITIRFKHENGLRIMSVSSDRQTTTKILDSTREIIFDSCGSGCSVCGDETTYYLPDNLPEKLNGMLEVEIYLGHGYEVVKE